MLLDWLTEAKLERVGAFKYEPVRGAPPTISACRWCRPRCSSSRYDRFMRHQQAISARLMQRRVGKRLQVIIDEPARRWPRAAPSSTRRRSTAVSRLRAPPAARRRHRDRQDRAGRRL
jgi:tRNA A37 methylthiotransferase MiaB